MESDGFTLVKKSRKRRNIKFYKDCRYDVSDCADMTSINLNKMIKTVIASDSSFCDKIATVISEECISEIVCYGIGRISSCKIALYQLATLIALAQACSNVENVYLFDPVLDTTERTLISEHISILPQNDMCNRRVKCNTLFYMIHSSKRMYDNVLKSNWDQLDRCTILGNSFQSYLLHNLDSVLERQVPHVYHSSKHSTEIELPPFTGYPNVFNDTVITTNFSLPRDIVEQGEMEVDIMGDGMEIIDGDNFAKETP